MKIPDINIRANVTIESAWRKEPPTVDEVTRHRWFWHRAFDGADETPIALAVHDGAVDLCPTIKGPRPALAAAIRMGMKGEWAPCIPPSSARQGLNPGGGSPAASSSAVVPEREETGAPITFRRLSAEERREAADEGQELRRTAEEHARRMRPISDIARLRNVERDRDAWKAECEATRLALDEALERIAALEAPR